jgi:hypothetical protein
LLLPLELSTVVEPPVLVAVDVVPSGAPVLPVLMALVVTTPTPVDDDPAPAPSVVASIVAESLGLSGHPLAITSHKHSV